jgi:hypothetical protein
MDFFTAEVLTWSGRATYYVLFLIQLETRRVNLAGMTKHPAEEWMQQVARNLTDAEAGALQVQGCMTATRSFAINVDEASPEAWNRCGLRHVLQPERVR